jgi:uncharacterized RDD family membrane protein YckC
MKQPPSITAARVAAWGIDCLIGAGLSSLLGPIGWFFAIGYWLVRDGLFEGQSIGKRVMGLRVVTLEPVGPCTMAGSFLRNVLWILPIANIAMAIATVVYLIRSGSARHWGDRLAGTAVVATNA